MTGGSFSEFRDIGITEPLRQGDVLESASSDATPWNRHLLVITADCDLAHDKHHGRVTCVPLLAKDEYLHLLQVPRISEQVVGRLLKALQGELSRADVPVISETRLRQWPSEQSTDEIISALRISSRRDGAVRATFDALRQVTAPQESLAEAVTALVEAQGCLPNAKSPKNLKGEIRSRLQQAFTQPAGDALFLSSIAYGHDAGYFAFLRHLEQVWHQDIALGPSRANCRYRRLSRLRETYTHALSQRFALVYMSIGLPKDYEDMRNLHAELIEEDVV